MSEKKAWACTVQELTQAVGGQLLSETVQSFSSVGTDSRSDLTGRLFIALKGDKFDAHDFVPQAVAQKASVVLVSQMRDEWKPLTSSTTFIKVADTLTALQAFARWWRKKQNFQVLAITGSNGKTSTKEFTLALMRPHRSVYASRGSFNNHWGVPLSILEAGPEHTHLILEMGMNHSGEIWRLCQIAEPNAVVVTTVGRAHIGELGSQDAVAQAKEEIYTAAPKAVQVFNADNEWTMRMQARSRSKQIVFSSFKNDVDVHFRAQRLTWEGLDVLGQISGVKGHTWVHVMGRQNVVNLMAAASLCIAAGLEPEKIWEGLSTLRDSAWGRNQILTLTNGARVLWDGYNANPDSTTALLKNLYEMECAGRKFLIMGDMLELGEFSEKSHEEVGERAAAIGFEGVWYIGKNAAAFARGLERGQKPAQFWSTPDVDLKISQQLLAMLRLEDLVAIKGSRGMALERAFEAWPLQSPLGKKP